MRRSALAAAILVIPLLALAASPRLTESEARGKRIFLRGETSAPVPIVARLGEESIEVPATVVPCASCHGYDGRGRSEGGVAPPSLRWDELTKPYPVPGGRQHPPYTPSSLRRSIAMGIDPAGHALQRIMPRYRMTQRDMQDLLAYLRKLPADVDPGLTDGAIHLGILLPPGERAAVIRSVMTAYFAKLNEAGGIFSRRIELRFAAGVAKLDGEEPFAILAPTLIGSEEEVETYAGRNDIPLIAAIAVNAPRGRTSFHLLPGLSEQAATLAGAFPGALVLYEDAAPFREVAASLHAAAMTTDPAQLAGHDAVLIVGPSSLQRKAMHAAASLDAPPHLLIPGALSIVDPVEIPVNVQIHTAMPLVLFDVQPVASEELRTLGVTAPSPTLIGALAAAKITVEALRRAGHDVTREKLIITLENFYEVDTALTPKITFTPSRHVGVTTAHVVP
jgi:Cytochrome c